MAWNTFSFNWSAVSTFPTNYTVKNVYIDVAGALNQNYTSGSVWIDDVAGLADAAAPTVAITSPTSNLTYDTLAATVDLGGTAGDVPAGPP